MKTMYPPDYHHNGFVATHALGFIIYVIMIIIKYMHVIGHLGIYIYIYITYIYIYIYITYKLVISDS